MLYRNDCKGTGKRYYEKKGTVPNVYVIYLD